MIRVNNNIELRHPSLKYLIRPLGTKPYLLQNNDEIKKASMEPMT